MLNILVVVCNLMMVARAADPKPMRAELTKVTVPYSGCYCNDGSPAIYYFKKGNPKRWLLYLAAGEIS